MRSLAAVALASTLSFPALPVIAHHSATQFDSTKTTTLSGVVKDFEYTNPHSWLIIDVIAPGGKITTWSFESQGPGFLLRAGIRKSDLPAGTRVAVTGHPMRDGTPAATWVKAVRADGRILSPAGNRPQSRLQQSDGTLLRAEASTTPGGHDVSAKHC